MTPLHSRRDNPKNTFALIFSISKGFHFHNMNGLSPHTKRKQYPGSITERPQKQHKPSAGMDLTPQNSETPDYDQHTEVEFEELRVAPGVADTAEWQACIEKVVRNVVSIRFCQTCSFDSESALTSEATGFVVDAERG